MEIGIKTAPRLGSELRTIAKEKRKAERRAPAGKIWRTMKVIWLAGALVAFFHLEHVASEVPAWRVPFQIGICAIGAAAWPLVVTGLVVDAAYSAIFISADTVTPVSAKAVEV